MVTNGIVRLMAQRKNLITIKWDCWNGIYVNQNQIILINPL